MENSQSVIGKYRLGKTLGSGCSAKVKLAQDEHNSLVALKIFDLTNPLNDKHLV